MASYQKYKNIEKMNLKAKTSSVTHGLALESITIQKTKIYLSFETQISKNGRPFRLSGTSKVLTKPSKWIDMVEKWHWIHSFIYLDKQGGFFEIELDYNGNFVSLSKG